MHACSRPRLTAAAICLATGFAASARAQQPEAGTLARWGPASGVVPPPPAHYRYKAVSAGFQHSLAIISNPNNDPALPVDGTMVAWGSDPLVAGVNVALAGVGWKAVSAGYEHNLAIDADGHVRAWGTANVFNEYAGKVPDDLAGVTVSAIAAGENLSAVLLSASVNDSARLRFWGKSEAFQASLATQPEDKFTEISANGHHLLARRSDGIVVGWGTNLSPLSYDWGQVSHVPAQNFGAFTAGHWHSAALDAAGHWVDQSPHDFWGPDWDQAPGGGMNHLAGNNWGQCRYSPSENQGCGNVLCGIVTPCSNNPCYRAPPTPMPTMIQIEGGYFQNSAMTTYRGLIAWGRNDVEQCEPPQGHFITFSAKFNHGLAIHGCYPNCDGSTTPPVLNINDFACFNNAFSAGDTYANCDGSTTPPVLNVADFACFNNLFSGGCIRP